MLGLWRLSEALGQKPDRFSDDGQVLQFATVEELFKGRHFDQEIVVLCVRWYLSYKLSYRDLVAMLGERGVALAHTTILRWVQYYTPEFEKRWNRFARAVGGSWRMDETYVKVRGEWVYLYRAVDKAGKTVDFYLRRKRDVNASKAFLRKAMKAQRTPNQDYPRRLRGLPPCGGRFEAEWRVAEASPGLSRRVKQRLRPMLGLKSFRTAAVVIGGIELAEKIKKYQFKIGKLGGAKARNPAIWQTALAA